MAVNVRAATASDADSCGRIIYNAFSSIADRHGFAPDFPEVAAAIGFAKTLTSHPKVYGVVAELDGEIVGSNFLWERDEILAVGPITIDPKHQGGGIGRQLMTTVLTRAQNAVGVRLVQDAFNTSSIALYTSLGFGVREPLVLMRGKPKGKPAPAVTVRSLAETDMAACESLAKRCHGFARGGEVGDALSFLNPFAVVRDGRISGYLTMPEFWPANHGVAETDEDMRNLILGAAAACEGPISLILPVRQSDLFRWCLSEQLRVIKPMTLMTMGVYNQPNGAYFPSVFY